MRTILALAILLSFLATAHAGCSTAQMRALAQEHSNNMARREQMDHNGFSSRASRGARAENVAYGYSTEAATMGQWRSSPGHLANLMLPGCRAVAHAVSKSGRYYWTMEIGK